MKSKKTKILILGANGLFGSTIFHYLKTSNNYVWAGISSKKDIKYFKKKKVLVFNKINNKKNLNDFLKKLNFFLKVNKFDYIINCMGYTIHQKNINLKDKRIINGYFPNLIADLSYKKNFKFIHLSTDCVFDGKKGNYKETDSANSKSEYAISKKQGEIKNNLNTITLRTSGIGHELYKKNNLLEWFLGQQNKSVFGYKNKYFSGPTTLEVAKILEKIIYNKRFYHGLFHISAKKISKYNLLKVINSVYKKNIKIIPKKTKKMNRSLNSSKLRRIYNYKLKNWNILLKELKGFNEKFLQK